MARKYELELGLMRTDRGLFIDKGNLSVSVKHPDFGGGGARGDGVHDDGGAWNEAVKHLPTEGGTIVVPPGDYLLTTAFSFNSQDNIMLWLMPGVVLTGEALPAATGNNYILDWRAGNVPTSLGTEPTGTTDRITVTSGVIDIATGYVGQTSITTLGTIATGAVPASIVTTGTFSAGDYTFPAGVTVDVDLVVSGTSDLIGDITITGDIFNPDATTGHVMSGGSTANLGSNIQLFGETHATRADDIDFRTGTTSKLGWDDSASLWTMAGDLAVTTTKISLNGPGTAQAGFHSAGASGSGEAAPYWFEITDAAPDSKVWRLAAEGDQFIGRAYADDYGFGSSSQWLVVTRSVQNITQVELKTSANGILLLTASGGVKTPYFFEGTLATSQYRLAGKGALSTSGSGSILHVGFSTATNWASMSISETGVVTTIAGPLVTSETVTFATATTSLASFRVPHGTAPTSPTNGDFWTTTAGVFAEINGSTVGPFGVIGAAAAGSLTGTTLASNVVSSSLTSLGTIASLVATTVDINGGALDGVSIGSSVRGAGAFTSLTFLQSAAVSTQFTNSHATAPNGLVMSFSNNDPNDATQLFFSGLGSATTRFELRSNGGLANFQSNNVDLSDERVKDIIGPVDSQKCWDVVEALEIITYTHKDDGTKRVAMGLSAQEVRKILPGSVTNYQYKRGQPPMLAIHSKDIEYYVYQTVKMLQDRVKQLETQLA